MDIILSAPETQDEGVWKYEHLRQFCMELNGLAVKLQSECKPEICTQMTATEQWIFLCAAHKTPKECPAIDYTRWGFPVCCFPAEEMYPCTYIANCDSVLIVTLSSDTLLMARLVS